MTKILIDTNIVIDLLAKRESFYKSAAQLFSLADKQKIELSISALTFANTNYILSRLKSTQEAREVLRRFRILIKVLPLNDKIIDLALNDNNFNDFEDGLQYYSAVENQCEYIVTRNIDDYKNSKIKVVLPEEFIRMFQ